MIRAEPGVKSLGVSIDPGRSPDGSGRSYQGSWRCLWHIACVRTSPMWPFNKADTLPSKPKRTRHEAEELLVTLHAIEDPYFPDNISSASEDLKAGCARLVALEIDVVNARGGVISVSG